MSLFITEIPKSQLGIYEYTHEMFKIIGTLIEACLKPYLFDLLQHQRIARNKDFNFSETPKLGVMIKEIYDTIAEKELMAPEPWKIRLSQWRNIAQHHNIKIENNSIICAYGESNNRHEIILTREMLGDLANKIMSVFRVIKLAQTIYFIDNLDEIEPLIDNINIREETKLLNLAAGLSTQGFKLDNIDITSDFAKAKIIDLQEITQVRIAHASQFIIPLWLHTKKQNIIIEYYDAHRHIIATLSVSGSACEQLVNGNIGLENYIKLINFNMET